MRDLKTLKGILRDFELGGDDFDATIVWVPSKPENQNDEEAMKEWTCRSNMAIVTHMQLLEYKGLADIEFVVKETEKGSPVYKLSSMRKRYEGESSRRPDRASSSKCHAALSPNSVISCGVNGVSNSSRLSSSSGGSSEELEHVEARVIPTEFRNKILQLGGSEESIKFVIGKALTRTDVDDHQGRLSVPLRQLENEFLTAEEQGIIVSNEIISTFIEPNCNVHCMLNVQKWKSTTGYQLVKPWNDVVLRNGLKALMEVELWTFRIGSQLGLALILVK